MKRKLCSIILTLAMTASLLAGCASEKTSVGTENNAQSSAGQVQQENGSEEAVAEVTTYPIDTDTTFTYWGVLNGNVSANFNSLGDTEIAKMWQENTGVTIEFQHPTAGQDKEQFNLIIADGNYPDFWHYTWSNSSTYPGGPEKAIADGVILDLTDLINNYCPNLKAYLEANPDVDKQVKTDSGKYYCFPSIKEIDEGCTCMGPMIRKDILDDLRLELPETIEEWHDVLTAFKENGVEIPLSWYYPDKGRTFGYAWGTPETFVVDDGKCVYGPSKAAYKDYLTTMKQWYQEGLLNPDMFSGGEDLTNTMLASGKIGATMAWTGGTLQTVTLLQRPENPDYELSACKWPVLNKGDKPMYGFRNTKFFDGGIAIGGTCKDPVLAAKVLDYGYSEDGYMMFNFGKEGISYTMEDGKPVYTDIIKNNEDGWPVGQAMAKYIMACYNGPFVQSGDYQLQYFNIDEARDAMYTWNDCGSDETTLPTISPTEEESVEYATIINEMNTYVEEMTSKFILGTEDIESGFDKYIETLNQLGLERATEIMNNALERFNNR
ncbi:MULTISPECIES: extracellular solute-binding protein [Eisenbergiella]|uniref:Extracellular solute-binding protein n=1 Tax=Eisenbergiella massiliensis TaxID=1720294 RepID=A0A3E3I4P4_9FIRM|nr:MULTISPECIES: extracellular solute-binding protein [Eisenbergiella]RGE60248.1 extracellular solute-binding protein [Eisenbergiella massiliensis]